MKVVIYGIKSTAKIIAEILRDDQSFQVIGFLGNKLEKKKFKGKKIYLDIPFLGDEDLIPKLAMNGVDGFIIGMGNIKLKEKLYNKFSNEGLKPISAISKNSIISIGAKIDKGVAIGKGSIISADVKIGENTFIGNGTLIEVSSSISHNCKIGSKVLISPDVKIEKNVSIGNSSTILSSISIGKNNAIKAGIVVSKNVKPKLTAKK